MFAEFQSMGVELDRARLIGYHENAVLYGDNVDRQIVVWRQDVWKSFFV